MRYFCETDKRKEDCEGVGENQEQPLDAEKQSFKERRTNHRRRRLHERRLAFLLSPSSCAQHLALKLKWLLYIHVCRALVEVIQCIVVVFVDRKNEPD